MSSEVPDKRQDIIQLLLENKENIILTKGNIKDVMFERHSKDSDCKIAFRGLTYDNELFPTVLRGLSDKISNHAELRKYENSLYEDYNRYSIQYLPYYESLADWIASAQHYGLRTRLLDWTYNPLVALFFAINNEENEVDSYILAADVEYTINDFFYFRETTAQEDEFTYKRKWQLQKNLDWMDCPENKQGHADNPKNTISKNDFDIKVKIDRNLCFLETNDANPRIIAQEGIFQICRFLSPETYCSSLEEIKEHLIEEIQDKIKHIYVIPNENKAELRELLNEMKITTPKLFPDLTSICRFINSNLHRCKVSRNF